jgi:hypothetical protein
MPHKSGRPHGSHADSAGSTWESPLRSAENRSMAGKRAGRHLDAPLNYAYGMLCQYSIPATVSSEKHQATPGSKGAGRGSQSAMVATDQMLWGATILGARFLWSAAD